MRLSMVLIALSLFLLAIILPSPAQNVKDKGLILYFSFDKENGGKIKDQTGGGNDGDLNKGEINTKESVYGKGALEMKDPQSSLEVESFKELEDYQDNSYLFWLYFIEGTNGAWSQIIAKKAPGSDRSPGIWICPDTLNIHWRFNPGNTGCDRCGPDGEGSLFKLKKWYHVAGVKKGTDLFYYVDGKEVAKKTGQPKDHTQGEEKLYIGRSGPVNYRSATFIIDDLYVYNRALKEKEVNGVKEGKLLAVAPQDKLTALWAHIKRKAL